MSEFRLPFTNARIVRENCPSEVYLAESREPRGHPGYVMSRSEMMRVYICAQKWLRGWEQESTPSTDFGSLADCSLLQPHEFDKRFVIKPDTYPAEKTGEQKKFTLASKWCQEWMAQNQQGRTVISRQDFEDVEKALDRLYEDPTTEELMDGAKVQVLVMADYKDSATGITVPVKGLIDIVPTSKRFASCLVDFKTAQSASPSKWARVVWDRHYAVQASFYSDLYNAATGEDRTSFLHLIVENSAPFEPGRRVLSQEFMELGRMKYLAALERYCSCLSTGIWPGYDEPDRCLPTLPGWQLTQPETFMVSSYAA